MYKGDKNKFGTAELAAMEKRKLVAHIKNPDEVADNLEKGAALAGEQVYSTYCVVCHQNDGKGDGSRFPPLDSSEWVSGDKKRLIDILLNGLNKPITVKGQSYNELMPQHSLLSDKDIAQVITYIRQNFNNNSSAVSTAEVAKVRNAKK